MKLQLWREEDNEIKILGKQNLRSFWRLGERFENLMKNKWMIQVDFYKYNKVLKVLLEDWMVVVEPGIKIEDLNNELWKYNLEFVIPLETHNITI